MEPRRKLTADERHRRNVERRAVAFRELTIDLDRHETEESYGEVTLVLRHDAGLIVGGDVLPGRKLKFD